MKPSIYLAASFVRKEELRGYARQLEKIGCTVTSRWLDGSHDGPADHSVSDEAAHRFAIEDLVDVGRSNIVIHFTKGGRGGRHVEHGAAIMQNLILGTPALMVVGEIENIFQRIQGVKHFAYWSDCLAHIKEIAEHEPSRVVRVDGSPANGSGSVRLAGS